MKLHLVLKCCKLEIYQSKFLLKSCAYTCEPSCKVSQVFKIQYLDLGIFSHTHTHSFINNCTMMSETVWMINHLFKKIINPVIAVYATVLFLVQFYQAGCPDWVVVIFFPLQQDMTFNSIPILYQFLIRCPIAYSTADDQCIHKQKYMIFCIADHIFTFFSWMQWNQMMRLSRF